MTTDAPLWTITVIIGDPSFIRLDSIPSSHPPSVHWQLIGYAGPSVGKRGVGFGHGNGKKLYYYLIHWDS